MKQTKIILHLGAHKTGTTLLQRTLRKNQEILAEKGIKYISFAEIGKTRLKQYLRRGIEKSNKVFCKEELLKQLFHSYSQSYDTFLISCENIFGETLGFYPVFEQLCAEFAELTENYEVRVVYYLRRQDEFLNSCYIELHHIGEYISPDTYLSAMKFSLAGSLSWQKKIDYLSQIYHPEMVKVGFFDYILHGVENYLDYFLDLANIPISSEQLKLPQEHFLNQGASARSFWIASRLFPFISNRKIRKKIIQKLRRVPYVRSGKKTKVLTLDQAKNIVSNYWAENEAIIEKYAAGDSFLKARWNPSRQ